MDKNLVIKAQLDNSEFDQQVQRLEQKINQMQQKQNVGQNIQQTSAMGASTKAFFGDYNKDSIQNLKEAYTINQRKLQTETAELKTRQRELQSIEKSEATLNASQKERLNMLKEEVKLLKERGQAGITEQANIRNQIQSLGGDTSGLGGGKPPGGGPPKAPGKGVSEDQTGLMGKFKSALTTAVIGSIVQGGLDTYKYTIERDRKILGAQAEAAQIVGRPLREMMAGRGSEQMFWLPERQRAMQMAQREQAGQGTLDWMKIGGSAITGAIGGGLVGGPLGAIAGGIGGAGAALMSSDKLMARAFDPTMYQALQSKEAMQKAEANFAAQQAMDPRKLAAREAWNRDWRKYYGVQQTLGITPSAMFGAPEKRAEIPTAVPGTPADLSRLGEVYGAKQPVGALLAPATEGWLQKQMRLSGGMEEQDIMDSMQGILGAGGTTRAARALSGQAAGLGQRFGQTNAADVIGKLTGAGVQETSAIEQYKRIMSEAVKLGVNASEMPREMQRFTEITSEMVARTGNVDVAAMMQQTMGGTTKLGMEAGAGVFESMSERVGRAGGWEGQMGFAAMSRSPILNKLSVQEKNLLNSMNLTELTADNPLISDIASKTGETSQDVLKELQGIAKEKTFRSERTEEKAQAFGEFAKGKTPEETAEAIKRGEAKGSYLELMAEQYATTGQKPSTMLGQLGLAKGLGAMQEGTFFTPMGVSPEIEKIAAGPMLGEGGALSAEKKAAAEGDKFRLDALRDNVDKFADAARQVTASSIEYNIAFDGFKKAIKDGADLMAKYNEYLDKLAKQAATNNLIDTSSIGKTK